METWKFFDITHAEHVVCNPSSVEKLARLVGLLRLPRGARVLEIACGKGEMLAQLLERYEVSAVGVDLSPYCIRDARERLAARAPGADVRLLEMNGADYRPEEGQLFDATICLGASWIYEGHRGTLAALQAMTKPGGMIVTGEPYWRQAPDEAYLQMADLSREMFGSHDENAQAGIAMGLELLHTIVSSEDDWDVYEGLQWYASARYARENPDDPDVPELLARVGGQQQEYLQYGRETLGWAIYMYGNVG